MPSRTRTSAGNLPHQLTSFIGRRAEVRAAKRQLARSRLVTLTGVGGVGKTRLAVEVGETVRRAFPDGVWLVELDEIHDGSLVPQTVAAVLGLHEARDRSPVSVLATHLAERRLLLVLDNCEHLSDAVAGLVEALLGFGPGLRVLATSRAPLAVAGEAVLPVPPLPTPDPSRETPPGQLALCDAVALFVDRGRVRAGFALTETNATAVARICHRLDGLPLGIELAAAWLVALSPAQIDDRLGNRMALLTRGNRAAPGRHRTLRACVEWSFELCAEEEQRLWARLSVFAGCFERDAVEEVCGAGGLPGLLAKSIVTREQHGEVIRYRMLETLRGYGLERLRAAGTEPEFRRRHRDWYERLALRAQADWVGPRQLAWLDRLEAAHPEIRAALGFSLDTPGEHGSALRICAALHSFWLGRGLTSEGRGWLDRALAAADDRTVDALRAVYTATILAAVQGDITAAAELERRALRIGDHLGDPWSRAIATLAGGAPALHGGDPHTAATKLRRALGVFQAERDVYWTLMAQSGLAMSLAILGDTAGAADEYRSLLSLTRTSGEIRMQAMALWALGLGLWTEDEPRKAAQRVRESLRLRDQIGDAFGAALCLDVLAWIAARDERFPHAATLLGVVEALSRTMGAPTVTYPDLATYHDECVKRCREALGERRFQTATERGGRLGLDEAVAYALGRDDGERPAPAEVTRRRSAPAEVTRREWEICELVAEGLTNREIAARLTISQRTAESHVQNVLDKLGLANRGLIAAWVAQRR